MTETTIVCIIILALFTFGDSIAKIIDAIAERIKGKKKDD